MWAFLIAAWCGHTVASQALADDIKTALGALGWKDETLADEMAISRHELSRQLSGKDPLNVWRLETALMKHPRLALALLKLRAARLGAEVLTAEDVAFVRGAFALGKKKMARILPAIVHERKVS